MPMEIPSSLPGTDQKFGDDWRKSSRSAAGDSNCVELTMQPGTGELEGKFGLRDSKDQGGPALVLTKGARAAFLAGVALDDFDR